MTGGTTAGRIGVLWQGDISAPFTTRQNDMYQEISGALEACQAVVEPIVFSDDSVATVRKLLLDLDGVLVWVNPIESGQDRTILNEMLREVAAEGVWVSTHPEVILKMGTKEVLFHTRHLGWGSDTHLYRTPQELLIGLAPLLEAGPRVLKRSLGSSGDGVWKLELVRDGSPTTEATVRVQSALPDSNVQELTLGDFAQQCRPFFTGEGTMIDQPFQARLEEGMVRCYLTHDRVVGFGFHLVKSLLPPPQPQAPQRLYYGPQKPEFQLLKTKVESEWVPDMQKVLGIDTESLPAIWDVDFLLGSKTESGEDTYVLCEINVQSVYSIPEEALEPLAQAAVRGMGRQTDGRIRA
jgi:hypothetical protein